MEKVIIVIGDVADDKCSPIRAKMVAEGDLPLTRRFTDLDDFMPSRVGLLEHVVRDLQSEDAPVSQLDFLFMRYISEHLSAIGYIGAIIMDDKNWSKWRESHHTKLYETCKLGDDPLDRHVVHANGAVAMMDW